MTGAWDFKRRADGAVVISIEGDGVAFNTAFDPEQWAALVASVSAQGDAPERRGLIRNFHMYEPVGVDANGSPVPESGLTAGKPGC